MLTDRELVFGIGAFLILLAALGFLADRWDARRPPLRASAGRSHSEAVLPAAANVERPAEPPRGSSGAGPTG